MVKKMYTQPNVRVIVVEEADLMAGSVSSVGSNLTGDEAITLEGAGSVDARSREGEGLWDEE